MNRLIVGISGASGVKLGILLLRLLREQSQWESHLVCTAAAQTNILHETSYSLEEVYALAHVVHDYHNLGASIASGSFKTAGMVLIPCSMKSLSAIANSYSDNLLTRAADVCLKERRKLVLLPRESPLHSGHLRNMLSVSEMGGIIMPPVLSHYIQPQSLEDMEMHLICKVLDIFGIDLPQYKRWTGLASAPAGPCDSPDQAQAKTLTGTLI